MDFQANSYWAIIGSKERRAALAEHCIKPNPPAEKAPWMPLPVYHCASQAGTVSWKHRQCFGGGEHWPLFLVIHSSACSWAIRVWCPTASKGLLSRGWHTEAKRPLHLWPLTKLLQERRGSGCQEHRSGYWLVSFSSLSRAGSLLSKGTGCAKSWSSSMCQVPLGTPGEALKSL